MPRTRAKKRRRANSKHTVWPTGSRAKRYITSRYLGNTQSTPGKIPRPDAPPRPPRSWTAYA
eukprot:1171510-Lingulodinium_polyedra.AAC.1